MVYKIENRDQDFSAGPIRGLSTHPHLHTHMELVYITEGSSVATVDHKEFLIETGDLLLTFPNQVHYYHDRSKTGGIILIFSPDLFKDLRELFQNKVPVSPLLKKEQMTFDTKGRLKRILKKIQSADAFDRIAAKGYLLALLAELLPLMTLIPNKSDQDSIKRLLQYCSENYTEPLTLDSISSNLHLNKYYISHIFKERMDIGFTDFVNNLRIEHACGLLERGVSITEVAFSSGFSSIRTFNRCFLQNMGMTPREYIKKKEQ